MRNVKAIYSLQNLSASLHFVESRCILKGCDFMFRAYEDACRGERICDGDYIKPLMGEKHELLANCIRFSRKRV